MATLETLPNEDAARAGRILGWLGYGFAALGILAILAPAAATVAAVVFVAALMLVWGVLGVAMSFALRPLPEWGISAVAFGLLAALGAIFIAFPRIGIETLTLFAIAGFLVEGVVSILIGLRSSRVGGGWRWMVASGVASLVLGLIVLIGWPGTATWLVGLLFGINFLTTGIALLAFRSAVKALAR